MYEDNFQFIRIWLSAWIFESLNYVQCVFYNEILLSTQLVAVGLCWYRPLEKKCPKMTFQRNSDLLIFWTIVSIPILIIIIQHSIYFNIEWCMARERERIEKKSFQLQRIFPSTKNRNKSENFCRHRIAFCKTMNLDMKKR